MSMTDPAQVGRQYADEANLSTRAAVWRPGPDGREPADVIVAAVQAATPSAVLEVGCGTGVLASRLLSELGPDAHLVAVDTSERFVDLTAQRGVPARVADVQALPFPDDSFDVVVAAWMLYHVPDLHAGLAEVARVLRPGGRFVAVTNGDEHVADLRREAGGAPMITHFSAENGEAALRRHFADIARDDLHTRAVFPDHVGALAYLRSSHEDVDWSLPPFEEPREYAGHAVVFVAHTTGGAS